MTDGVRDVLEGRARWAVEQADARAFLTALPDGCVHLCCTSPPYFGLRDYGDPNQLGLEATLDEYVANLVSVFREVRRVLRPDATLWLNLGDSYASGGGQAGNDNKGDPAVKSMDRRRLELKEKNLLGVPWRVAFALQADGWTLRSDIIWAKPNPMPESVTDRPTKSHEYLFLLAKSPKYFFDADAVREPHAPHHFDSRSEHNGGGDSSLQLSGRGGVYHPTGRNLRSVWSLPPEPFRGSHFATMPSRLVERCVRAGTSEYGVCPACRAPWRRIVERKAMIIARSERTHSFGRTRTSGTMVEPPEAKTVGWRPGCACGRPDVMSALVLDPFSGAGTVPLVALRLGRRGLGCELNAKYVAMACRRIVADAPLFNHEPEPSGEQEEERDLPCVS